MLPSIFERVGLALKRRGFGRYLIGRLLVDLLLYPSDLYKVVSTYRHTFGRIPNLLWPTTFNEWLQRAKLFRRKHIYICFADKILAREIVRQKIGRDVLAQAYWIGSDLNEAPASDLPTSFVIKTNNGSGQNLIVRDKEHLNWEKTRALVSQWMLSDHSVYFAEWQYRWIEPKILIEELIVTANGNVPSDFKLFCFHGCVEVIQVDLDRFGKHTRAMFDRDFNPLPVAYQYEKPAALPARPKCLEQMIEIAERLSMGEPFLRVDLYDIGRPVFGELTLHPEAGNGKFEPPEWDAKLFELLNPRLRR